MSRLDGQRTPMAGGPLAAPLGAPVASTAANPDQGQERSNGGEGLLRPARTHITGAQPRTPRRFRVAHVDWLRERLSERDWQVIQSLHRLRITSSLQLERLHFTDLAASSRARIRRRVLQRLVDWRVLQPLERRIGGVRAGSAGLVFALDTAGTQLVHGDGRRRATTPGERFLAHALAVSDTYVQLVEATRSHSSLELVTFLAEPACWTADGAGGVLKPDAYAVIATSQQETSWWLEIDRSTEHLPTLRRKLQTYLDYYHRGQLGPNNVMPWVLLSVLNARRQTELQGLVSTLESPAEQLFHVCLANDTGEYLMRRSVDT